MFTINIKGKANPKNDSLVKLELVFFKRGYSRVTKVLPITGAFKDWDNAAQSFRSKSGDCIAKNKNLLDLRLKYQKVAEYWEAESRAWSPVELSHCFDEDVEKKKSIKVLTVCQMIDLLIDRFYKKGHQSMSFCYFITLRTIQRMAINSKNENSPIVITESHIGNPSPNPSAKTAPFRDSNGLMELNWNAPY